MTNTLRLGWIGAGRMGTKMIDRLLSSGCEVAVYNRTRSKAAPLEERGAVLVDSPADLADRDIVFCMVSASDDLVAVICGEGGLLSGAVAPSILVDSSTVSEAASSTVRAAAAERGTQLLCAPVSGNPKVVGSGRSTIAVSGPSDAFDIVEPYLRQIARSVTYVGEDDRARLVKIAHNLVLGIVAQALAETTVLIEKAGITRAAYLEFLNDSVMGSTFTRYKTPGIVELDWTPTFTPILLRKDLDLGLEAAASLGATLPLVETAREAVQRMIDHGLDDLDFQALLLMQAEVARLPLVPEPGPVSDGLETPLTNGQPLAPAAPEPQP